MIIKYNSYAHNKTQSGYEEIIDNIQKIKTTQILEPIEKNDSNTQKMWDTISFFINNPELTTINRKCSANGNNTIEDTNDKYFSHDRLNVNLLQIGHECLDNNDCEKRKISIVDNIDYRFLKEVKQQRAFSINCLNLIRENEIISLLTNSTVYIMNDEGKTIQVIRP